MDKDKNRQAALKIFDFMASDPEFDNFNMYDILHILKIAEKMAENLFQINTFKEATRNCLRMAEVNQSSDKS